MLEAVARVFSSSVSAKAIATSSDSGMVFEGVLVMRRDRGRDKQFPMQGSGWSSYKLFCEICD